MIAHSLFEVAKFVGTLGNVAEQLERVGVYRAEKVDTGFKGGGQMGKGGSRVLLLAVGAGKNIGCLSDFGRTGLLNWIAELYQGGGKRGYVGRLGASSLLRRSGIDVDICGQVHSESERFLGRLGRDRRIG